MSTKTFQRLLSDMTEEDFFQKLDEHLAIATRCGNNQPESLASANRLVYGLRGIQSLFNCSHKQAQYYKDRIICEAVSQNGRKIVVDADLALKLFNQRRAK